MTDAWLRAVGRGMGQNKRHVQTLFVAGEFCSPDLANNRQEALGIIVDRSNGETACR